MSSSKSEKLKTVMLTSIFAASVLVATANANIIKLDEYGFEANKLCLDDDVIRPTHVNDPKSELLGRTQSAEWDMELYAHKETGDWTLLGKSRDPAAYPEETCVLSVGSKYTPYQKEKWYALYFEKIVPPIVKTSTQPDAPKLN